MQHPTNHFFEHTPETLGDWCVSMGWQRFRAKQILEWVYAKGVLDPGEMTNLGRREREELAQEMTFLSSDVRAHQVATDGTQKLLVQWRNAGETIEADPQAGTLAHSLPILGAGSGSGVAGKVLGIDYEAGDPSRQTECVMIPAESEAGGSRRTACISSQVGCPVGCKFCASGLGGLDGNLSRGRIVEQVWRLGRLEGVGRISNIVFMGMGEPLANFKAVTGAVQTLSADWGLGIGARRITVSTVGLPQAIQRLAREVDLPITLALSLHAPNDELRRELIPWASYTTIDDLVEACRMWFDKTGREITLEYILLRGVNDRERHAVELAGVVKRLRANVNLIRYNEVAGLPFQRPATDDVRAFQETLKRHGINTHIRASRGRDIAAACGQLRHEATA